MFKMLRSRRRNAAIITFTCHPGYADVLVNRLVVEETGEEECQRKGMDSSFIEKRRGRN